MRLLVIINDQAGQGLSDLASLFEISDFFDSARGLPIDSPGVAPGSRISKITDAWAERVDRV